MKKFAQLVERNKLAIRAVVPLASVGILFLVRQYLDRWLGGHGALLIFLLAVSFSAWCGGGSSGLFATALGALCGWYFFLGGEQGLSVSSSSDIIRVAMFVANGIVISILFSLVHQRRTEGKRESDRIQFLLGKMPMGMWRVDTNLRFVEDSVGGAIEKIPENARAKAGDALTDLVAHADDREAVLKAHRQALAGKDARYETTWMGRFYECFVSPIRERGKVVGAIGFATDHTARREEETVLREAKMRAESANQAKTTFLANMSHELRTPLTAVLGFTELSANPQVSASQRQQFANTILRNGRHLANLIDDLLDVARIDSKELRIERVRTSLPDLVDDVLANLAQQAIGKGIFLHCEPLEGVPETIVTDPQRLRQILFNLVGNAIKFTSVGGVTIRIKLAAGRMSTHSQVAFEVEDTGIGIPFDRRDTLFRVFSQVNESYSRSYGGTGLGLALSRDLARLLGGDVELVRSEPNVGSTFVAAVPALEPRGEFDRANQQMSIAFGARCDPTLLAGLKVLVVEDAPDNQVLIVQLLRAHGATTVEAVDNGKLGVDRASNGEFDIVLMDLHMPLMDGFEATRILRSRGFKTPILALTAAAMKEDRERALAAGMDDHLSKPVSARELVEKVSAYSAKSRPTPFAKPSGNSIKAEENHAAK